MLLFPPPSGRAITSPGNSSSSQLRLSSSASNLRSSADQSKHTGSSHTDSGIVRGTTPWRSSNATFMCSSCVTGKSQPNSSATLCCPGTAQLMTFAVFTRISPDSVATRTPLTAPAEVSNPTTFPESNCAPRSRVCSSMYMPNCRAENQPQRRGCSNAQVVSARCGKCC